MFCPLVTWFVHNPVSIFVVQLPCVPQTGQATMVNQLGELVVWRISSSPKDPLRDHLCDTFADLMPVIVSRITFTHVPTIWYSKRHVVTNFASISVEFHAENCEQFHFLDYPLIFGKFHVFKIYSLDGGENSIGAEGMVSGMKQLGENDSLVGRNTFPN